MPEQQAELNWFNRWVLRYSSLFGFSEAETLSIASWQDCLGATEGELQAATDAIAEDHGETIGRSKANTGGKLAVHLDALRFQIRKLRTIQHAKESDIPPEDPRGTCSLCSGTGLVIVPHLECVQDGRWVPLCKTRGGVGHLYTMAVLCTCQLGRWTGEHIREESSRPMKLETYRRLNPMWESQEFRRAKEEQAYRVASRPLFGPDTKLDETLRRLEAALSMP